MTLRLISPAVSDTERSIMLGECKWSSRPVGVNIWSDLKAKVQEVCLAEQFEHVHDVLFSEMGFTSAMRAEAKECDIRLVEPGEMVT